MLKMNLQRIFMLRGIEKPVVFMVKIGISRAIAYNIFNDKAIAVRYRDLERLCTALNCTPNDLFDWQPDAETKISETHSLHTVKHDAATETLKSLTNDLSIERLIEVKNFIGELKNREVK